MHSQIKFNFIKAHICIKTLAHIPIQNFYRSFVCFFKLFIINNHPEVEQPQIIKLQLLCSIDRKFIIFHPYEIIIRIMVEMCHLIYTFEF